MKTKKYFLFIGILLVAFSSAQSQVRLFELDEILELAVANAFEIKTSKSLLKENVFQLALQKEERKPQVMLNATLPNLSRSIESRPLPDGRDAFVNRSTMYNNVNVQMDYQLTKTGGTIYARSSLDRLDILKTDQHAHSQNYFYTPISLGFHQPFFEFNELKWRKERNNLLNKELTMQQFSIREDVIQRALLKYINAFQAQLNLDLAKQKVNESDSLLQIKQRLFDIGKANKIEMLSLELELARNKQRLEETQLDWEKYRIELCDYIGLNRKILKGLHPPPPIQNTIIDLEKALDLTLNNVFQQAQFHRRLRESEIEVEKVEKNKGILFDINASLGLNKSSERLNNLVQNLENQQTISLGISIPLTGVRSRRINRDIASEQLFREQMKIQQEKIDLARTVVMDVKSYTLLQKNIDLNKKAMAFSLEIYQLTSQQYLLGNHTITELNIARTRRDQELLKYYSSILDAILKYYEIRQSCLYDFVGNHSLITE